MSGGNENGNYYLSFNYNKQIGQLQKSGYKRYTGKINLDQVVKSWLKVGTSNSFIYTNEQPVGNGNMFITALRACPLLPLSKEYWYMREGKIDNQSASNPLRDLYIDADIFSNRLMSTNYVTITPLKGLNIRSTFSIDLLQSENYSYFPTTSTQSYKSVYDGQSVQVKSKNANWQWDNSLSYERTFADRHRLSLILGTNRSFYDYNYNQQNANGYNNDLFSYKYSQGLQIKRTFTWLPTLYLIPSLPICPELTIPTIPGIISPYQAGTTDRRNLAPTINGVSFLQLPAHGILPVRISWTISMYSATFAYVWDMASPETRISRIMAT